MSINDLCDKAQCVHINMSCVFSLSAVSMLTKKSDVLRNILKIPSSTCTSPFPSARLLCCFVFHVSVWHDCCFMSPLVCTHVLGSPVFVFLFDFLLWQPNHDSAAHFYAADPPSASGQMTDYAEQNGLMPSPRISRAQSSWGLCRLKGELLRRHLLLCESFAYSITHVEPHGFSKLSEKTQRE